MFLLSLKEEKRIEKSLLYLFVCLFVFNLDFKSV